MPALRVLLAEVPGLLLESLGAVLESEPGVVVVDVTTPDPAAIRNALAVRTADIVVVGVPRETELAIYDPVLYAHPRLRLLAVVGAGSEATLYELRPTREPLGRLTREAFLATLRGTTAGAAR